MILQGSKLHGGGVCSICAPQCVHPSILALMGINATIEEFGKETLDSVRHRYTEGRSKQDIIDDLKQDGPNTLPNSECASIGDILDHRVNNYENVGNVHLGQTGDLHLYDVVKTTEHQKQKAEIRDRKHSQLGSNQKASPNGIATAVHQNFIVEYEAGGTHPICITLSDNEEECREYDTVTRDECNNFQKSRQVNCREEDGFLQDLPNYSQLLVAENTSECDKLSNSSSVKKGKIARQTKENCLKLSVPSKAEVVPNSTIYYLLEQQKGCTRMHLPIKKGAQNRAYDLTSDNDQWQRAININTNASEIVFEKQTSEKQLTEQPLMKADAIARHLNDFQMITDNAAEDVNLYTQLKIKKQKHAQTYSGASVSQNDNLSNSTTDAITCNSYQLSKPQNTSNLYTESGVEVPTAICEMPYTNLSLFTRPWIGGTASQSLMDGLNYKQPFQPSRFSNLDVNNSNIRVELSPHGDVNTNETYRSPQLLQGRPSIPRGICDSEFTSVLEPTSRHTTPSIDVSSSQQQSIPSPVVPMVDQHHQIFLKQNQAVSSVMPNMNETSIASSNLNPSTTTSVLQDEDKSNLGYLQLEPQFTDIPNTTDFPVRPSETEPSWRPWVLNPAIAKPQEALNLSTTRIMSPKTALRLLDQKIDSSTACVPSMLQNETPGETYSSGASFSIPITAHEIPNNNLVSCNPELVRLVTTAEDSFTLQPPCRMMNVRMLVPWPYTSNPVLSSPQLVSLLRKKSTHANVDSEQDSAYPQQPRVVSSWSLAPPIAPPTNDKSCPEIKDHNAHLPTVLPPDEESHFLPICDITPHGSVQLLPGAPRMTRNESEHDTDDDLPDLTD